MTKPKNVQRAWSLRLVSILFVTNGLSLSLDIYFIDCPFPYRESYEMGHTVFVGFKATMFFLRYLESKQLIFVMISHSDICLLNYQCPATNTFQNSRVKLIQIEKLRFSQNWLSKSW